MNGPGRSLGNVCGLLALVLMASRSADRPVATDCVTVARPQQVSRATFPTAGRMTSAPVGAARFRPVSPGVVTVKPARTDDLEAIEKLVVEGGGRVFGRCGLKSAPSLKVEVDAPTLAKLMERGDVAWLANPEPKFLHNDVAVRVMGVTNVWPSANGSAQSLGLTGRGQFVSTSDSGIDTGDLSTIHRDFTNSLLGFSTLQYWAGKRYRTTLARDEDGHGTHTAGSIAGDGTMSDGKIRGAAPDHLNNAESVRISSAAAGTYEVSVVSVVIPHSSDEGGAAALYVRGAFDPRR